ncbi:hypothetical protein MKK75_06865 [Methylobacterium sp. J-030]|uniref:hypothetical protein n=1 Tax=Methylobacterium sp. J-030 TaxID=2836627 RepID=UPI001FB9D0B8|nr:hypothetical protein [Methylobacterium sp. J-030]MCJ2068527.1 hypothetical protein [Methylobacterium sp. J-030]
MADLAQAWDQAVIDWNGIQPKSQAENWCDEQLDEALDAYDAVFRRAIDEPSRDMAELQAKARLLLHDLIEHTTGHDPSDEATLTVDEQLTRLVLREVASLSSSTALTPLSDPIFAAIKTHTAAHDAFSAACNPADKVWRRQHGLDTSAEAMAPVKAAYETASADETKAWLGLFKVPPTTLPGVLALIRHAQTHASNNDGLTGGPDIDDVFGAIADSLEAVANNPTPEPTDWHAPPPGFMAYPADDPQGFVIIREGLRLELERLHRIALAEYARKVGPDATDAKRAHLRRELRLAVFESASPNGGAEILALGMDLDAAHVRWRAATPAYWAAQAHVTHACERAKARGGSAYAANVAAWNAPGIREADDLFETIGGELERISKAIWRTPARTPLGLAVKARATLVMVFISGQYERDSHLGEGEDLTEQATRALIEACCALAGVDWKGQPIGEEQRPTSTSQSEFEADCAWAKAQAADIDLSGLSLLQLTNLFENFVKAADDWLNLDGQPWLEQNPDSPYRTPNTAGHLVDREQNRAAWIRDRIIKEMHNRTAATDSERDRRLEALIRYELLCEGSLHHAPELRAEIAKAWGGCPPRPSP